MLRRLNARRSGVTDQASVRGNRRVLLHREGVGPALATSRRVPWRIRILSRALCHNHRWYVAFAVARTKAATAVSRAAAPRLGPSFVPKSAPLGALPQAANAGPARGAAASPEARRRCVSASDGGRRTNIPVQVLRAIGLSSLALATLRGLPSFVALVHSSALDTVV